MHTSMLGFGHSRRLTGAESTADRMARYELKLLSRRRCYVQSAHSTSQPLCMLIYHSEC